jgi:hypothetical protein
MKSAKAWLLVGLAMPALALTDDGGKYQCTMGDLVRRVEIYTEPGVTVPCEVHYYKDTEAPGDSQVLWSAQSQAGYCKQKATEFVARLEGWGWDCGAGVAVEPAPEAEPEQAAEPDVQDDTDVLSPGDPDGG